MSDSEKPANRGPDTKIVYVYVPKSQYNKWDTEAEIRNQSLSSLVATMTELGLNEFDDEDYPSSEITELRKKISQLRSERDDLRRSLDSKSEQEYHVGLGKIKDLIIDSPGIEEREIVNYVVENSAEFVHRYLQELEASEFTHVNGKWYPPAELGDDE